MLQLIYGTNQIAIRDFVLKSAKAAEASVIKEYNLEDDSLNVIETTLQADIFGASALNVIDVTKIVKVQLEKLFESLKRYPAANIVLISGKDLETTSPLVKVVRAFKGRVVPATLARPKEVFRYLDDLFNKREAQCYKSLQKLLEVDDDPVYILVMLQYQLKNMALAKFGLVNKLPPFQQSLAQQQAKNFTENQIFDLYELLYNYDVALKMGKIVPETVALLVTQKVLLG